MQATRALAPAVALLLLVAALMPTTLSATVSGGAASERVGGHNVTAWAATTPGTGQPHSTFAPGDTVYLTVRVALSPAGNYTGQVNAAPNLPAGSTTVAAKTMTFPAWNGSNTTTLPRVELSFTIPANASTGDANFTLTVSIQDADNATLAPANATFALPFRVEAPGPGIVDPGTPWMLIFVIAAAVLAVGGAGFAIAARRRRPKVAPRSRALQQMEMERKIERLEQKAEDSPEAAAEAQALREEMHTQELARQKSRELMILEAKRDDALKSMDLLRKRRETGQLTELQFTKMMEKKQQQYEALQREVEEMERSEGGSGGSAA